MVRNEHAVPLKRLLTLRYHKALPLAAESTTAALTVHTWGELVSDPLAKDFAALFARASAFFSAFHFATSDLLLVILQVR
jgi:hypothetical protein